MFVACQIDFYVDGTGTWLYNISKILLFQHVKLIINIYIRSILDTTIYFAVMIINQNNKTQVGIEMYIPFHSTHGRLVD